MPGLFQGLEIGKRALLTHQLALQTIGHNIANVNTPGYSRQRVNIRTSYPENAQVGIVGSGVQVEDIRHIRDLFLGNRFRHENKSLGQWNYKDKILRQIESLFNEPNDNSLSDMLNDFWNSWADLATTNTISSREAIVSQAKRLSNGFHQLAGQLSALGSAVNNDLTTMTGEINSLAKEIARLNFLIQIQEAGKYNANDLRDTRDYLIDQLSSLIDVNTVEKSNGGNIVYIGAMALVDGSDALLLDIEVVNENGTPRNKLIWKGTDREVRNLNGQLKGLMEARDKIIPAYLSQLHTLAQALITEVNALHSTGFDLNGDDGINFFDTAYTDAFNIKINPLILLDPSRITASATGEVGDNSVALALNDLQNNKVMTNNALTMNEFYNGLIGKLGIEVSEAKSFSTNYELLVHQVQNARLSVEGVSLDEEMANLIKYQHAYDAAARVITTMDQALDTVINGMGIVGR